MLAKSFSSGCTLRAALVGGYLEHFSLERYKNTTSSSHEIETLT